MGEIRVKIKLTNWFDTELAGRGELSPAQVRTCEVEATVDTGAVRSVVPVAVVDQLGVRSNRRTVAQYAYGRRDAVELTNPIVFDIGTRSTIETAMVLGDEVLIGQTTLETTDLLADCANRRLVPNPEHPDQPVMKVRVVTFQNNPPAGASPHVSETGASLPNAS